MNGGCGSSSFTGREALDGELVLITALQAVGQRP